MAKKIQLSIPEPCHENWNAMTPTDKGRFCASCQKQVIDFSTMSDRQIAQFFKKPSTGSVCGRFMQDQLDRDIDIPRKRIPWVKYFFQFALPAFLFSMKARAQGAVILKSDTTKSPRVLMKGKPYISEKASESALGQLKIPPLSIDIIEKQEKLSRPATPVVISGKVVDENGVTLPYANIGIKGKGSVFNIASDTNGLFSLSLAESKEEIILIVSHIGFEVKEVLVTRGNFKSVQNIVLLSANTFFEGNIVIAGYVSPKRYKKTKRKEVCAVPDTKIKSTADEKVSTIASIPALIKDTLNRFFKTYPNPVKSGASLNIEWRQQETGNYFLQLISNGGQLLYSRQLWIDQDAKALSLDIPAVAAGSYFLRITNSGSGKSFTEKIIIQ